MGVSIRAYARHRGVSDTAVRKAIRAGRITTESDGTVDVETADSQWSRNTDKTQQRKKPVVTRPVPKAAMEAVDATLRESGSPASGTTFMQARTANEVLKAQTRRVKLQKLKGEVVDRAGAIATVFRLARTERDAWLNWPSRVSAEMAARLEVDPHTLHVVLEAAVRDHLAEIGEIQPKVD